MNNFPIFSSIFWPIVCIIVGIAGLINSIVALTSKKYASQFLINLRAMSSNDYSSYKFLFGAGPRHWYLWVKMFGPEKTYKLSRSVFAPVAIIFGLILIALGLYLIISK